MHRSSLSHFCIGICSFEIINSIYIFKWLPSLSICTNISVVQKCVNLCLEFWHSHTVYIFVFNLIFCQSIPAYHLLPSAGTSNFLLLSFHNIYYIKSELLFLAFKAIQNLPRLFILITFSVPQEPCTPITCNYPLPFHSIPKSFHQSTTQVI